MGLSVKKCFLLTFSLNQSNKFLIIVSSRVSSPQAKYMNLDSKPKFFLPKLLKMSIPSRKSKHFCRKCSFIPQRGPPWGLLNHDFSWKNRPYSEIPWKIFHFPDYNFFSSLSRRIFCSSLGGLFKRVTIKQLYRQIVPGYNLGLPGGCWTPISREKWYLCLSDLARIIFPISRNHFIFFLFTESKN